LQGKYYEGLGALQSAVLLQPDSTLIHNNMGFAYLQLAEYDKALEEYQTTLRLDPDDPVAHLNLGVIHRYYKKNGDLALEHYRRYLELDPDSSRKVAILQWMQEQENLLASPPATVAGEGLREDERRRLAIKYYTDGLDAMKAGDEREAMDQWTQAVSVDPWHAGANFQLAGGARKKAATELRRGLECLDRALRMEPDNEQFVELKRQLEDDLSRLEE
ncbi:tetratricopeptide repeat protein, partial [bacterium]|nr:tetratricopeptide repeat protein [candidate division CSSED10-310 bacterium]